MKYELMDLIMMVPRETRDRLIEDLTDCLGVVVSGARSLDLAGHEDISFCGSCGYIDNLRASGCAAAVVRDDLEIELPMRGKAVVRSSNPRLLLAYLLQPFLEAGIPKCEHLGLGRMVSEDCHIDQVAIGANTIIMHATIGKNCWIHPNVVIGDDGFGFERDPVTGAVLKMPHFGRVIIGDNVEIFPFCNIPRGSLGDTVIGNDVKIDALCHIAHNVSIGNGSFVIANSMLAGGVRVGERAWIAPSTSINNGAHVGDGAMTGTGSVVTRPVDDHSLVYGVPAKHARYLNE